MSEIKPEKPNIHINATSEVSQLLGLHKVAEDSHDTHAPASKKAHEPVNLPVVDSEVTSNSVVDSHAISTSHKSALTAAHNSSHDLSNEIETLAEAAEKQAPWKKALKTLAPYLAVFIVGLVLYYFFLSKTDLSTVLNKIKPATKTVQTQKETALQALEQQNLQSYRTWIAQYYFDVSDVKIIEPNADNSGNGLSNFQKYLLGLNPRSYDTLGLGMADSQALAGGINPLTGSPLTDAQKQILDKYFDMEVIMNRLALSNLNNSKNVAGASVNNLNNQANNQQAQNNQSGAGVNALGGQTNYNSGTGFGTVQPNNNQNTGSYVAPKTGANLKPFTEDSDIDQSRPGLLEIPSLKISVPVIWTQDSKNFDADLQSGVVHYPGTALPGQIGTTYISGHSSNYVWAKGSYNRVFSKLGDLSDNSSFVITVYTKQGKTVKYHYVVTHRAEFKATDQAQFENSGTGTVALSTCWPVNTTQKRLVVFGELTQTEK